MSATSENIVGGTCRGTPSVQEKLQHRRLGACSGRAAALRPIPIAVRGFLQKKLGKFLYAFALLTTVIM